MVLTLCSPKTTSTISSLSLAKWAEGRLISLECGREHCQNNQKASSQVDKVPCRTNTDRWVCMSFLCTTFAVLWVKKGVSEGFCRCSVWLQGMSSPLCGLYLQTKPFFHSSQTGGHWNLLCVWNIVAVKCPDRAYHVSAFCGNCAQIFNSLWPIGHSVPSGFNQACCWLIPWCSLLHLCHGRMSSKVQVHLVVFMDVTGPKYSREATIPVAVWISFSHSFFAVSCFSIISHVSTHRNYNTSHKFTLPLFLKQILVQTVGIAGDRSLRLPCFLNPVPLWSQSPGQEMREGRDVNENVSSCTSISASHTLSTKQMRSKPISLCKRA